MKYCEFCGSKLGFFEACTCSEAMKHPEIKRKNLMKIIGTTVIAIAILMAAIAGISTATAKTDPFDYVTVEFVGFNSIGIADISFDKDGLIKSVIGEEPDLSAEYFEWYELYEAYWNQIAFSCSKEIDLSNGDTITISIATTANAANEIKSSEQTFTVQGLIAANTVDVFKDIDVSFSGVSGNGVAEIVILNDSEILRACDFQIDKERFLSSGERIVVTIENTEEVMDKYGVIITDAVEIFTVSGLSEYITEVDQLPLEIIESFIPIYIEESKKEDDFLFSYSEPVYYKTYFGTAQYGSWRASKNLLLIFISYERYQDGKYRETVYIPLKFSDIVVTPDGTVSIEYSDGFTDVFTTCIDEFIIDLWNEYMLEEVEILYQASNDENASTNIDSNT